MNELKEVLFKIQLHNVHPEDQDDVLQYMLVLELYDLAYEFVLSHGIENVSAKTLSRICLRQLEQTQGKLNGNLLIQRL